MSARASQLEIFEVTSLEHSRMVHDLRSEWHAYDFSERSLHAELTNPRTTALLAVLAGVSPYLIEIRAICVLRWAFAARGCIT